MKILIVSNLYPPDVIGGYELGCRQAAEALRGRDHEVRVLTSAPRRPLPIEPGVERRLQLTDVWSHYLFQKRLPINSHLWQAESHRVNAFNVHALLDEVERFRPDVVYAWMLVGLGGLGLMASLQHIGQPWVWHLMDDVPALLCRRGSEPIEAFQRQYNRLLRGSYILCSRQLADEVERAGIALQDSVAIVPNWVEGTFEPALPRIRAAGSLRVMAAAGWVDRRGDKGLDLLVDSARLLRDRIGPNFEMDIYGQVVDTSIPDHIAEREVGDVVHLRGMRPQRELMDLAADYDVFAFPTRPREPFGFAPLEAAARGCVPVISQVCGLAEWLVHGVHAIKAPRTAPAFARVFEGLIGNAIDLEGLRRRTAAAVTRDFHIEAIVPRIEAVLEAEAKRDRNGAGTADEAYRMALLGERLAQVLIQEPLCV